MISALTSAVLLAALFFQIAAGPQTVPYYISDGTGVAGFDTKDGELAVSALEAWARESGNRLNFEDIMYYFGYGGDLEAYFLRYRNKLQSRNDIPRFSGISANDIAVLKKLH